jgi:membrane-bound serine protease (ClpP class)
VDVVIIISAIAAGLLVAELLLPTGGLLAIIGAAGFAAAGIVALGEDNEAGDYIGPGLITLGVLSLITVFVITPKVLRAHRDEPVRTGWEEVVGSVGEVREPLDPDGQVFVGGALWQARLADEGAEVGVGNRVRVESVDGLTLVVRPVSAGDPEPVEKGT